MIDFLELFQIRDQSHSIFQSFQKFYLKLDHFGEISEEHVQLEDGKRTESTPKFVSVQKLYLLLISKLFY